MKMEYPNWEQIASWWEYESENRPFYVLGANFGPWHTESYREKMAGIFARMQDVCFRDRYSRNLFADVPTVRRAPDILFSYPMPRVAAVEKQIFVSVIDCAGRDGSHGLRDFDEAYTAKMARFLRERLDEGYKLALASFCRAEGDERGIEKILAAMECPGHPGVRVLCYDGTNADELTAAMASSEAVVATRFHAAILALAAGRPVLPVVYSDKTLHVLEDLGFGGPVYDLRRDEEWTWAPGICEAPVEEAQVHFLKLDTALRR